jgi:hypothetical protein
MHSKIINANKNKALVFLDGIGVNFAKLILLKYRGRSLAVLAT